MTESRSNAQAFPFSAVIGQQPFKLALILAAINPAIGGVLVSGPRGCAKSTLVRALADLRDHAPFVTLPLGASEEMLIGSLDLQQALNDKQVSFRPGLLAKADQGVLYVDEVNLLADGLVDLLLDVAASGQNIVERDGISHAHDARFMLIGTMNPDEGELREQLKDRFGLMVQLSNQYSVEERVAVVQARDSFDRDPSGYIHSYDDQQQALQQRIQQASEQLDSVECPQAIYLAIATRCDAANVDGLRADIVWYRAAATHAAWRGSKQVENIDVDAVEEMVLAHRRQNDSPKPQPPQSPPPYQRPPSAPRNEQAPEHQTEGDWGGMASPQQQQSLATSVELPGQRVSKSGLAGTLDGGKRAGMQLGAGRKGQLTTDRPDWFRSFVEALPHWPPRQLVAKQERTGVLWLHLVLLDTSASTLQQQWFAQAKGVVLDIAKRAYLNREQLAIIGFGNDEQQTLLAKVRAPKELNQLLDTVPAAGGTPLRQAITHAVAYLTGLLRQQPQLQCTTYLITDGRSRDQLHDIQLPGESILVDTEQSQVKRGRGEELAAQLNAQYLSLMP